jgi:hypothetical protein
MIRIFSTSLKLVCYIEPSVNITWWDRKAALPALGMEFARKVGPIRLACAELGAIWAEGEPLQPVKFVFQSSQAVKER